MRIRKSIYRMIMNCLPIKAAYKLDYYKIHREKLNIKNPQKFTEKVYLLYRYNKIKFEEEINKIYDKFLVKRYLETQNLEDIIIPTIKVYDSVDEIDFDDLPSKFILKITKSSGGNIICKDISKLNREEVINKLRTWMEGDKEKKADKINGYYFNGKTRIICEELLETKDGGIPDDIRLYCFNGKVDFISIDFESIGAEFEKKKAYRRECFDLNWNRMDLVIANRKPYDSEIEVRKPENLQEMVKIAEKLSIGFPFMRVDLYDVDGKIYFGELTPVPGMAGGLKPEKYERLLGDKIIIDDIKLF